jgi:hypothetical protein
MALTMTSKMHRLIVEANRAEKPYFGGARGACIILQIEGWLVG